MHESAMHENNCFITLTYMEEHLPDRRQLYHKDFQDFLKRLRKKHEVRYYMAGEYGPALDRPHYHAAIFGYDFPDKQYLKQTGAGEKIYTSDELDKTWGKGYASVGELTFESAAYIARYCVTKVTGDPAEEHYKRFDHLGEYQLNPEYNRMSLKPGIGAPWLEKYQADVYNYDYVVVNGVETRPPKYYDKILDYKDPDRLEELKWERIIRAQERALDNTVERLLDREHVAKAKLTKLKRGKI